MQLFVLIAIAIILRCTHGGSLTQCSAILTFRGGKESTVTKPKADNTTTKTTKQTLEKTDKFKSKNYLKSSKKDSILVVLKKLYYKLRKLLFPSWNTIKTKSTSANDARIKSSKSIQRKSITGDSTERIQKELKNFKENPPHNCDVSVGSNIRIWVVTLIGVEGTVFAGEKYKLKFIFPKEYPSKPPAVYFLKPTPKHQHGKDWRPMMTAESIAVSILSMLSSAKEKKTPQDNAMHADSPPGQRQDNWMYHDDKC